MDLGFIKNDSFDFSNFSKIRGKNQLSQLILVEFLKTPNTLLDSGSGGEKVFATNDKSQAEIIARRATTMTLRRIQARQDNYKLNPPEKLKDLRFKELTRLSSSNSWKISLEVETQGNGTTTLKI